MVRPAVLLRALYMAAWTRHFDVHVGGIPGGARAPCWAGARPTLGHPPAAAAAVARVRLLGPCRARLGWCYKGF